MVSKIAHYASLPVSLMNPVAGAVVSNVGNIANNASHMLKGDMSVPHMASATKMNIGNI